MRPKNNHNHGSHGQKGQPSDEERALLREMRKAKKGKGQGRERGWGRRMRKGGVSTEEGTEEEVEEWESEWDDEGGMIGREMAVERVGERWDKKLPCFKLFVSNSILSDYHQLHTDRPISKEIISAIRELRSDLLLSNLRKC